MFLISTQWILSWLDNHHLIMNWRLSCKDMILSVMIKSIDIFPLTLFLRFIVLLICKKYWPLLQDTRIIICTYMDTRYKLWFSERLQAFFFINIYSFALLLDSHQLIIDCLFSVKTSNFEIWKKILAVFHSLFHGECHSSADIKGCQLLFLMQATAIYIYIYI